jgi:serine/threonine-protein kinase Chk1
MAAAVLSESRELPDNLPFHVGDILGSGAFATYVPLLPHSCSVRLARDLRSPQLYAVKFIDKIAALNGHDPESPKGKQMLRQIALEVALHRTCAEHRNVIGFIATMETRVWRWIALEWAEGGDLFDKIGASPVRLD